MKAMILAAGFGKRLYPLTKDIPKALVKVNKIPMIDTVLNKLISYGFNQIIINLHYLPELIINHIKNNKYNAEIIFSIEKKILNTGGGVKNIISFFKDKPFLLYNVDVFSDLDLKNLYLGHLKNDCIATLVVKKRETQRYLLFNEEKILCGREKDKVQIIRKKHKILERYAFSGIHIIDPIVFKLSDKKDQFSIIDLYMGLCKNNIIKAFVDNSYWMDLGKIENIKKLEQYLKKETIYD